MSIKAILSGSVDNLDQSIFFFMMDKVAKMTLENENVQKLVNDRSEHFDMVIAEWMFSELYAG